MLTHRLHTKQTADDGQPVHKLIVQADAEPAKEYYLGIVLDRAIGLPVLMASAEGGMDIEEVAAHTPEKIFRVPLSPETGLLPFQARELAYRLGFEVSQVDKAAAIMLALSKVYFDKDATIAEVNPLAVTKSGDVVVLDAKLDFDDNALFRHKDIQALRDLAEENPVEIRAGQANLNYIQLDGTIACLVNGAGLAMATMDIINYHGHEFGIKPANFLDVGGGVTADAAIEAFRIILADPKVKGVLVNIFGGIAKCDLIADALVKAGREVGFRVPVVVRLEGTNAGQGPGHPDRREGRVADDPRRRRADRGGQTGGAVEPVTRRASDGHRRSADDQADDRGGVLRLDFPTGERGQRLGTGRRHTDPGGGWGHAAAGNAPRNASELDRASLLAVRDRPQSRPGDDRNRTRPRPRPGPRAGHYGLRRSAAVGTRVGDGPAGLGRRGVQPRPTGRARSPAGCNSI